MPVPVSVLPTNNPVTLFSVSNVLVELAGTPPLTNVLLAGLFVN